MNKILHVLDSIYCSQGDTSGRRNPKKFFEKAEGCYLTDFDGIKYLDMQMQNSSANFGYQNLIFNNALINQINVLPSLASEFMNEQRVLLSTEICKYMEKNYHIKGRVHFNVGGAQAIDDALKLVANYTGNKSVFCFEGGYHGRTMTASSASSSYRYKRQFGAVIQTYRIPFPNCAHCAYNKIKETCNLYCLSRFERLFQSEYYDVYDNNSNECAYSAFLCEMVLGRGGYVVPPQNYFKELKRILDKYHIILIDDEVQMGFYRTGKQWAFENFDIVPDIIVFGKAITNGLWPVSGIWAKEDLINPKIWPCGSSHSTFAGHPLGMTLGLETFKLLQDKKNKDKIKKSSLLFKKVIEDLPKRYNIIGRVDIIGHAAGIEIIDPKTKTPDKKTAKKISEKMMNEPILINGTLYGLIVTVGGIFENTFMLSPNILIDEDNLELFSKLINHYLNYTI